MITSLAHRQETGGGSAPAVPAGPNTATYLLPAIRRGTAGQAAAALGIPTGPWAVLPQFFILPPDRYPRSAASRVPARTAAVTTPGRLGARPDGEGETSP